MCGVLHGEKPVQECGDLRFWGSATKSLEFAGVIRECQEPARRSRACNDRVTGVAGRTTVWQARKVGAYRRESPGRSPLGEPAEIAACGGPTLHDMRHPARCAG